MKITSFTEIDSWRESRIFVKSIYDISLKDKLSKDFGLRDQIRRASVSVMSNIAEGFDSGSKRSFKNFLTISYRSASEVESLLFVMLDLNYIQEFEYNELSERINKIKKMIGGFINYLKTKIN